MSSKRVARWSLVGLLVSGALAFAGLVAAPSFAADSASIYIVQGLPGETLDVSIDGDSVAKGVKTAEVAGPFEVPAGRREVTFASDGKVLERTFSVQAKSSWDVVVHLPAQTSGTPLITVFKNDLSAVPKGKASLTVAHVAAVPPAGIRVNGKVLFENIANGESLNLVVPMATYKVAIVPTGQTEPVILGPVDLTVKADSLNRVYAVGDPDKKTMNVAVHVISLSTKGSEKPSKVATGTGGQVVGQEPAVYVDLLR
ncbi:MAG TPA: DUF4397 domain-containing protein [Propionibacteriaceae bacterium]|nr:DUF4397 domain-containing protein [Propionibacteriaceae bacterium]